MRRFPWRLAAAFALLVTAGYPAFAISPQLPTSPMAGASTISATIGQVPFNFQVGDDVKKIPLDAPQSAAAAHDMCLRFTRRAVDPIWVIYSVQLVE